MNVLCWDVQFESWVVMPKEIYSLCLLRHNIATYNWTHGKVLHKMIWQL